MLGWFKKKFAKKTEGPPAEQPADVEPLTAEEEVLPAESPEIPEPVHPAPAEVEATAVPPLPETLPRELEKEPEQAAIPEKMAQKTEEAPVSLFKRLAEKLSKTREAFTYQLDTLFLGRKVIDAELFDDLEELLITADLGVATTRELLDHARRRVSRKELSDPESLKVALKEKIKSFITASPDGCRAGHARKRALRHHGHRRQRGRQDHHHRQNRPQIRQGRPLGDARGRRHLPGRRRLPTADLG